MSNLKTMEQLEDQTIRSFDDTEFGVLGKDDARLAEWSPITRVDQIVAALRRRQVPVEYMRIANEGHG